MASYNKITLLGNVAAEPRSSINGNATDIYLAVNGSRKDDPPLFINVRTFNTTAQFVQKYVTKGACVLIEGRLVLDTFTDKSGREQKRYNINATIVQLIGGIRSDKPHHAGGSGYQPNQAQETPNDDGEFVF